MSLPAPMGFWGWLRWNYQGRPDLNYVFHERTPRWYPHASLSPGGVRRAQDFDKRMRIYYDAMEWLVRPDPDGLIARDDTSFNWDDHSEDGPWAHNMRVRARDREERMASYKYGS